MKVILNDRRKRSHVTPVLASDNEDVKDAPQVSMKKTLWLLMQYIFSLTRNPISSMETSAIKQLEAIRTHSNVATARWPDTFKRTAEKGKLQTPPW